MAMNDAGQVKITKDPIHACPFTWREEDTIFEVIILFQLKAIYVCLVLVDISNTSVNF